MSRASYGADVFSPIRGTTSFIDESLNVGREDFFGQPYDGFGETENFERKKNNPYVPFFLKDGTSSKDDSPLATKSDKTVEKKNKKDLSSETDLNRLSYVTTRRNKSYKNKNETVSIQGSRSTQNDKALKARKKNHVTVIPEADSNKEINSVLPVKKCIQTENTVFETLCEVRNLKLQEGNLDKKHEIESTIAENFNVESFSSSDSKFKQFKESGVIQERQVSLKDKNSKTRKKNHVTAGPEANSNEKLDSEVPINKYIQVEKPAFASLSKENCIEVQRLNPDEENRGEFTVLENSKVESLSSLNSKPNQIQANIEKLVKDAVSFEFDGIRQMLYLQHLQILKYIDRNPVNCHLQKIIEELLDENRRLKNIIAHQNT